MYYRIIVGGVGGLIVSAVRDFIVGGLIGEELILIGICIAGLFLGGITEALISICLGKKVLHYLI